MSATAQGQRRLARTIGLPGWATRRRLSGAFKNTCASDGSRMCPLQRLTAWVAAVRPATASNMTAANPRLASRLATASRLRAEVRTLASFTDEDVPGYGPVPDLVTRRIDGAREASHVISLRDERTNGSRRRRLVASPPVQFCVTPLARESVRSLLRRVVIVAPCQR